MGIYFILIAIMNGILHMELGDKASMLYLNIILLLVLLEVELETGFTRICWQYLVWFF